jgi:hypothetical protein
MQQLIVRTFEFCTGILKKTVNLLYPNAGQTLNYTNLNFSI